MNKTVRLAEKLRRKYFLVRSWPKTSIACGVLTPAGKANPRLAQMIAGGYEPRKIETRIRLDLSPVCPACQRRAPRPHSIPPPWVTAAADWLEERLVEREAK